MCSIDSLHHSLVYNLAQKMSMACHELLEHLLSGNGISLVSPTSQRPKLNISHLGTWKNKRASCLVPHIHVEVSKVHTGHGGKKAEMCDFMWNSCAALPTSTIVWACLSCVTQMDWLKWNLEPKGWQISQFLGIERERPQEIPQLYCQDMPSTSILVSTMCARSSYEEPIFLALSAAPSKRMRIWEFLSFIQWF